MARDHPFGDIQQAAWLHTRYDPTMAPSSTLRRSSAAERPGNTERDLLSIRSPGAANMAKALSRSPGFPRGGLASVPHSHRHETCPQHRYLRSISSRRFRSRPRRSAVIDDQAVRIKLGKNKSGRLVSCRVRPAGAGKVNRSPRTASVWKFEVLELFGDPLNGSADVGPARDRFTTDLPTVVALPLNRRSGYLPPRRRRFAHGRPGAVPRWHDW